jgi:hypothetical protein
MWFTTGWDVVVVEAGPQKGDEVSSTGALGKAGDVAAHPDFVPGRKA